MHGRAELLASFPVFKQEEHAALQREREALRSRTDALQMTLMQTQGQGGGLAQDSSPAAILQKVRTAAIVPALS